MAPVVDEIIAIPVSDAHIIRAALNSAYHQNTVIDLTDQYRKLTQRPQDSKLTRALHEALTLFIHYIELGNPDDDEEASGDAGEG